MKAAIYARVSTADQRCELQLRDLRELCGRRGWEIAGEYVDTGWSGKLASRPELNRLKTDARARRFDAVLVWKLDRWGRSLINCIQSIQELDSLGIRFIASTQNIDTDDTNPMSRFLLYILAAFAELERALIQERVAAGMAIAKKSGTRSGKSIGRPKIVCDAARIAALKRQGWSVREIASRLGVSRSVVHRKLSQKAVA